MCWVFVSCGSFWFSPDVLLDDVSFLCSVLVLRVLVLNSIWFWRDFSEACLFSLGALPMASSLKVPETLLPLTNSSLPSSEGKSWSCTLSFSEVVVKGGSLAISVPPTEIDENLAFWKNTLVGYFIGSRLGFIALKQKIYQLWNPKAAMVIYSLDSGFLLFKFESEEDKVSVLERGPWFFFKRILLLKQ